MPFEGRFVNWATEGNCAFITTNVLGMLPVFSNERLASLGVASLLSDHRFYKAYLYGYVVMPNHWHLLSGVPHGHDVSWFVNRVKSNAGKRIARCLTQEQLEDLKAQPGAHNRVVWMEGFRSFSVNAERSFLEKLHYMHANPVKARLVEEPHAYGYSSAALWEEGVDTETGIEITDELIARFCAPGDLDLRP
jgi:putative transposase